MSKRSDQTADRDRTGANAGTTGVTVENSFGLLRSPSPSVARRPKRKLTFTGYTRSNTYETKASSAARPAPSRLTGAQTGLNAR
jgi:hypothetical protein